MRKLIKTGEIQQIIIELRGYQVILDADLAQIYQVPIKRLIEQVKRNIGRFPSDFMFQVTNEEAENLRSQIATSSWGGRRYLPYVFTRNGANMVSAILKSPIAIQRSILIMRAFSALEEMMSRRKHLDIQVPEIISKLSVHSKAIMHLFQENKGKTEEIDKIKRIMNEMIELLKQNVFKFK